MTDIKELSLKDLMQMQQDMEDLQKDLDMLMEFIEVDELRTILKIENDG